MIRYIYGKLSMRRGAMARSCQARQTLSHGCTSSSEDVGGGNVEDHASSTTPCSSVPIFYRARTWYEVLQNILWLICAAYFIYMGDWRSNMIFLLLQDGRIKRFLLENHVGRAEVATVEFFRTGLYFGLVVVILNAGLILYTTLTMGSTRVDKKHEPFSAVLLVIVLGMVSFCLFLCALWPIWSFMTIPLLFTLFMALMVILSYLLIGPLRHQALVLHADSFLPCQ